MRGDKRTGKTPVLDCRGGEIRTLDFQIPDLARYQAALRPARPMVRSTWQLAHTSSHFFNSSRTTGRERFPTSSLMDPTFSNSGRWSQCITKLGNVWPQSAHGTPSLSEA